MANKHKGEVQLVSEEGQTLLLVFDGNAYAHLEAAWGMGMKGVVEHISQWDEETLKLGELGDLLAALAQRHQPHFTRSDAMDLIGFPVPDEKVVASMMAAVQASLPAAKAPEPGEAQPPTTAASGTGTKLSPAGSTLVTVPLTNSGDKRPKRSRSPRKRTKSE